MVGERKHEAGEKSVLSDDIIGPVVVNGIIEIRAISSRKIWNCDRLRRQLKKKVPN